MQIDPERFLDDGFLILKNVVPPERLDGLRASFCTTKLTPKRLNLPLKTCCAKPAAKGLCLTGGSHPSVYSILTGILSLILWRVGKHRGTLSGRVITPACIISAWITSSVGLSARLSGRHLPCSWLKNYSPQAASY